jgi:thiosulfate/3-mercaptopyruvate sulfurtransferase
MAAGVRRWQPWPAVRAGYLGVRVYYLSFSDWAKDESCPIA